MQRVPAHISICYETVQYHAKSFALDAVVATALLQGEIKVLQPIEYCCSKLEMRV